MGFEIVMLSEIRDTLSRMIELLMLGGGNQWATALSRCYEGLNDAPDETIRTIFGMFGGGGSLNDVVLSSNGKMLVAENDEFYELRSELFRLCRAYLS